MKKKFLLLNVWLLCLGFISAQQQNSKIIFPNPPNFDNSTGLFVRPTSDGGYILTGLTENQTNVLPRLVKLDANLGTTWDNAYTIDPPPSQPYIVLQSAAIQNANGGYAIAFRNDSTTTDFLLLEAGGAILAQKDLFSWSNSCTLLGILPGGGYLLTREHSTFDLLHLDPDGNLTAQYSLGNIGNAKSILLANGDVLVCFKQNNKIIFRCTDISGNQIWQTDQDPNLLWWGNLEPVLVAMPDGGFAMLSYDSQTGKNRIYRFDGQGNQTWISPIDAIPATLVPTHLAVTADGVFLLSGRTAANRGFVAQMTPDGNGIGWSAESPEDGQEHITDLNAIPTADGWAAGVGPTSGNKFGFMRISENTGIFVNIISGFVVKDNNEDCIGDTGEPGLQATQVNATNGPETFQSYTNSDGFYSISVPSGDYTLSVSPNQPFFFLCPAADVSVSFPPNTGNTASRNLPMQSPGLIHEITGSVRLDQDNDCIADPNEPLLENWYVEINTGTHNIFTDTDADGEYSVFVPDGSYTVNLIPFNQNFSVCAPAVQIFSLTGPVPQTAAGHFTAHPAFECALMRAELSAWNMRPCSTAKVRVHYRNIGTLTAEDALLQVFLDPFLTYVDASLTPAGIDGQTVSFALGDVPISAGTSWSYIDIDVNMDCAAQIGDQVCITAQVQPDEMCFQSPEWSGAIVTVSGMCENDDKAIFTISNIGAAPNASLLDYTIIEDQIVLKQGTFQLDPGETVNDTVPGSGLPLTIIAQQEPGYPGDTAVVYQLFNCGAPNDNPPYGFGGPAGPFTYQECFAVTNSYDPNDKDATPQGFGSEHIVHPGTPLEYRIRFQNTGNDTAFLVVLRDTLSQFFDFRRIEPRGSSHVYDFAQVNDSILHISFYNIKLPDSTTNPVESQGFVEFLVYPKQNLPLGTKVSNRAAIYFDYNPPVMTNTVERTYGKVILVSIDEGAGTAQLPVRVFPNPFVDETTFELSEDAPPGAYRLILTDITGRTLSAMEFDGSRCRLRREDLPAGIFVWVISTDGPTVASGKLIAR